MRTKWWGNRRGVPGLLAAAAIVGAMSWLPQPRSVHAQANATGASQTVSPPPDDQHRPVQADLRIAHRLRTADGRDAGGAAPGVVLHVDRRSRGGRWRTTLTLSAIDRPEVRTARGVSLLDNPFLVTRLEYDDESGGEPRLYDRAGRRVRLPGAVERRALGLAARLRRTTWDVDEVAASVPILSGAGGAPSLASGLVATANRRQGRRQQLEARYGAPVGRLRGLDRFVVRRGEMTEEILVSPAANLPVELNTVRGGVLLSRVQLEYQPTSSGDMVRRAMRIEHLVDPSVGTRLATDVDVANLTVGVGGAQ